MYSLFNIIIILKNVPMTRGIEKIKSNFTIMSERWKRAIDLDNITPL